MKEKISEFLEEKGFRKNEHEVYLYKSEDGIHALNMAAILEDFEEYEEKTYIYAVVYSEDQFEGIRISGGHANLLRNLGTRFFPEFTSDIYEFHTIEVDYSHLAKDGSYGVKILNSIEEFKEWFVERFKHKMTPEILKIINEYEG